MYNDISNEKLKKAFFKNFVALKAEANKKISGLIGNQSGMKNTSGQQGITGSSVNSTPSDTFDVCIYATPPYTVGSPPDDLHNTPAVDQHGIRTPYFRKTSTTDAETGTFNLSCISGKAGNILYPCDEPFLRAFTSNTCGHITQIIQIPDDILVPDNSSATISARFRLPVNAASNPVFELVNGNTGDTLAVTGWAWMQVQSLGLGHSSPQLDVYRVFLSKEKVGQAEDGIYDNEFTVDLPFPELPAYTNRFIVVLGVTINTYTAREFNPDGIKLPATEYALVDFRSGATTEPQVLPPGLGERIGKRGTGGIRVSSVRVCLKGVKDSPFVYADPGPEFSSELEKNFVI